MPAEIAQGLEIEAQTPGALSEAEPASEGIETDQDSTPPSSSGEDNPADAEPQSLAEAMEAAFENAPDTDTAATDDTKPDTDDADPEGPDAAEGKDGKAEAGKSDEPKDGSDSEDDYTPEELADMRPKSRKRVEKLLSQRNSALKELEAVRPDATNYQQIRSFMEANQLQDREVADLFQLGADLKSGNPERLGKFLDRVMPFVQQALEATGRELPKDLREQVDAGEMTEDAAKAFSQSRTQAAYTQTQLERATQQQEQQRQMEAQRSVNAAITDWQSQMRQTDPDFDLKAEAMGRVAQALVAEKGLPKTPAEAVEYARVAHAEASRFVTAAKPAPKPSRPTPSHSASRSGLAPSATSLADVINQALDG